jgi:hypothetical protein
VEIKDKQPRVIKLPHRVASRQFLRYGLVIIAVVILVGVLTGIAIEIKHKSNSNKDTKLTNTVKQLKTSYHTCTDGMKELGSAVSPNFAQDTSYARPVREQVLSYVAPCEFSEGHSVQAIAYANQLEGLYKQDGTSGVKSYQQWQQTIQYIKTYSQK